MKYILILGLLFLSTLISFGQSDISFSVGLRNHSGGLGSLNRIIRQYNDSRDWLSNNLNEQIMQNGFEVGLEKSGEKFGVAALRYFRVWNSSTARGTTPAGEEITRKVKTRVGGIEIIDFWYNPLTVGKLQIGGGIMPMGLGIFRVHTKLNDEKWQKMPLSDLENLSEYSLFKTFHPFSNFHIDGLAELWDKRFHFQFFYSTNWFRDEYNLIYLNNTINPSTGGGLLGRQKHNQNQFGFKICLEL